MARVIDTRTNLDTAQPTTGLARLEDVNYEKLKKKYMESAKKGSLPNEERSVTEIQASEDARVTAEWLDFFEMTEDVDIDPMNDDPLEAMKRISEMMENSSKDVFEAAEAQREKNIEEDAAEHIEQVTQFTVNADDPLLDEDYKTKSEKIIQKLVLEKEKEETEKTGGVFEKAQTESRRQTSHYDSPFQTQNSGGFRTATTTQTKTVHETTTVNEEERQRQQAIQYQIGMESALNFAVHGPKKVRQKKERNVYDFGGKKKWRFSQVVGRVKRWFKSEDAALLTKYGIMVCLQMGIAVITRRFHFDGLSQTLGYLGMMMGVFYIGRELHSDGFDPRRLVLM